MTTAKDLFIVAMDRRSTGSVGQGDLSLALAGAELIDLLDAGTIGLDGDRVVPATTAPPTDGLLAAASEALLRTAPYEPVEDWLWRRGRDLAAAYQSALEADGQLSPERGGLLRLGARRVELVDSPARTLAVGRLEEAEPVLGALAAAIGLVDGPADADGDGDGDAGSESVAAPEGEAVAGAGSEGDPGARVAAGAAEDGAGDDDPVTAVLAAVNDAVMELEAVRQRRAIEESAFANVWRAP
ncbi:GPP34 family phosphoprotein [Streptomyces sp. NPDC097619]|uniref:GOLPH3/VPS74 family protein n=1 Tax=Streptomyces sp. NPDC097619 TaxID=3157228 RepID=UPI00332BB04B